MADNYWDSFLLDTVLPTVQATLDRSTVLFSMLKQTSKGIVSSAKGDYVISKTRVKSNQGIGARAKGAQLPAEKVGAFEDCKLGIKYSYAQFDLDGPEKVMSSGKSNEQVKSILLDKSEDLMDGFNNDVNRQIWSQGDGIIGKIKTGATGTVFEVYSTQYLEENMLVNFVTDGEDNVTINAIDDTVDPPTITIDSSKTLSTDCTIRRHGVGATDEMTGFLKMLFPTDWFTDHDPDTWGTYENIDRDSYKRQWRPLFLHQNGTLRDLTEKLFDDFILGPTNRSCSSNRAIVTTTAGIVMVKGLRQGHIVSTDYMDIGLGFKAPYYLTDKGRIPFVVDRHCPPNTFICLDLKDISLRMPQKVAWKFGDGGTILHHVENYDKERATLMLYCQLFNVSPRHCSVLTDVRYPTA